MGQNLVVNTLVPEGSFKQYEKLVKEPGPAAKLFDKLAWILMAVLYVVVIALVAWSFLFGGFSDTSSIFS
ncbi:MAG: hypothetical protein A2Z11_01000 [Candidatus Woykebacteria bacterium RBG_16_43_9]|uniref:Uncharacterized protein n=1 Tax=Candidatus Woykebacteria bacterium RBG_16_43_9 TaxID=1802596 RepID=A0A1G1WD70_9BACT|nr:MAG: hypothetical protein A2Z11_01000 [Candidatus Woykebacteria bacterium RBG_16_43_9]